MIEEATSQSVSGSGDPSPANQISVSVSGDSPSASHISAAISNRMDLLTACICDDDVKVKRIVDHVEIALSRKRYGN